MRNRGFSKKLPIEAAYRDLKAARANPIQAEKTASLRQLMAGIAHEIKNPLDFVNDFGAMSVDLLSELKETGAKSGERMEGTGGRREQALGVGQRITRRDILHGTAALAGSSFLTARSFGEPASHVTPPQDQLAYPPALTGLRGDHPGSFEVAHALRDGGIDVPSITPAVEQYDLVIVGGGISGLSAACFYLDTRPDARILILENHDDFGGHAKRNEFQLDGRIELLNGGTLEIDSPRRYSVGAAGLLRRLEIIPAAMDKAYAQHAFYSSLGLRRAVFLDRETFGADKLMVEHDGTSWTQRLTETPLTPRVRADIARIYEADADYLPGLSSDEKKARLARISYGDYLVRVVDADPGVLPFFVLVQAAAIPSRSWGIVLTTAGGA